jgi:hypothetical protein
MAMGRDNNGELTFQGFPVATQKITPGVTTSVHSTQLREDTFAVVLTCDTRTWVRMALATTNLAVVDGTSDHMLTPNVPQTLATKSCRYIAAIGGGGNLRVTELN